MTIFEPEYHGKCDSCENKGHNTFFKNKDIIYLCPICKVWLCPECFKKEHQDHEKEGNKWLDYKIVDNIPISFKDKKEEYTL